MVVCGRMKGKKNKGFELFYVTILFVCIIVFLFGSILVFPLDKVCECDCIDLPSELYFVQSYSEDEEGYFVADIKEIMPIKYIGGGVFVGKEE
jgi:hypothetical protein